MSRLVPPDGSPASRFALYAEAPASWEVSQGRPLVGPSGQLLARWWAQAGLKRTDFHLDNVSRAQAPGNKFAKLSREERAAAIASVPDRIAELPGPDGGGPLVVVACGEWALRAILGKGGITKHRGSLYEYVDRAGRTLKVAPVLHPAAIFRRPTWTRRCLEDWRRIAAEGASRELVLPQRDHRIEPSMADVCDFEAAVAAAPPEVPLAIDIETPRTRSTSWPSYSATCPCGWTWEETGPNATRSIAGRLRRVPAVRKTKSRSGVPAYWTHSDPEGVRLCTEPIETDALTKGGKPRAVDEKVTYGAARVTCVGFAISKDWSLTIPTTIGYWRDASLLDAAWAAIKRLCESRRPKLLQNGLFDWYYLKLDYGIDLVNYRWDTLAEHHTLHTAEDHSLAYLASRYTREPFYKEDHKGGGDLDGDEDDEDSDDGYEPHVEAEEYGDDWRRVYWRYCGKDVCVTHEVHGVLWKQLETAKRQGHYAKHYARFYRPLHEMMVGGIPIDEGLRRARYAELGDRLEAKRGEVRDAAGVDLFGPAGGISVTKMRDFLYNKLRLPRAYKRNDAGEMVLRTDAVTIRRHIVNHPAKLGAAGAALLDCVRMSKLRSFLAEGIVDPDGRFRCSFKFTTSACRLASATNPKRTGANLQNQDLEVRDLFLPEPGHLWLKWDLEQIESRLWALLTGDPELVRRALLPPWEFDEHCYNSRYVLGREITKADKLERTVMKTTNHGFQGGMGGKKLAEVLLKRGIVRSVSETNAYIDALAAAYPARDAYFKAIRMAMLREHRVVNDFGDVLEFDYERLDDDAFRKGYRFPMQSDGARIINGNGLYPLWRYLRARGDAGRLLAQVHDELDASVPPSAAWDVHSAVVASLTAPVEIAGVEFQPFVSVELGTSWKTSERFERLPTRLEFEAAVSRLTAKPSKPEEVAA